MNISVKKITHFGMIYNEVLLTRQTPSGNADETAAKIERWYQEDNCRSKNEFIEKAVNCYADMLAAGESATLPRAVQSAIDSRLKLFEDRIASLLYKQVVEMDMAETKLL